MGAKSSKTKEKKRKDGGRRLISETNSSTEPKSKSSQCFKRPMKKQQNEETTRENCSIASCDGRFSSGPDAGLHTNPHHHPSDAATVSHLENSSAQLCGRMLPPPPSTVVVREKEFSHHLAVLPKQISPSAVDDAVSGPFVLPNEPIVLYHNGLEVAGSSVQANEEEREKRNSIRSSFEGRYEDDRLGEIDDEPLYAQSTISEFNRENPPSTSAGNHKTPSNSDLTYMCIDTYGPVNNGTDLVEDPIERNLAESEYHVVHGGNANGIAEKLNRNLTGVKNLELGNWNKDNGVDDDPFSYVEACMKQNELPKKVDTRLAVKPESVSVHGHNKTTVPVSVLRMQNGGHADVERLNFPNAAAAAQIPRFLSQNPSSSSQWLSDNTIKHMRIFMLMKAECETNVTCTVSLRVLIGLAGPSMITKCLEDRIQKHEKEDFQKVDSFEVPLLNCSYCSIFNVKVSNIEWLPHVDVVTKDINSEVFEMNRFMNDSVVDPLFWQHLQLPKGLLKHQKFAATVSIQQDNCPEKSFKILESLQKVSDLPSKASAAKISQMIEDSAENRRFCGSVKQLNALRQSIASSDEIDLHSDGSAPDNNVLPDKIREETKQVDHFVAPEPCGLYFPN